jgi:hypothetical protein
MRSNIKNLVIALVVMFFVSSSYHPDNLGLPKAYAKDLSSKRITQYKSWDIPEFVDPNPNDATLAFYFHRHMVDQFGFDLHIVKPSHEPSPFEFNRKKNSFLDLQMKSSSILSYLYYSDNKVVYDEIVSDGRFGKFKDDYQYRSNSIGKSIVSYILGHAICEGFIGGLESKIDDWPILFNTLYSEQKISDLLNMRAQDQKYVDDQKGLINSGRWYNIHSIEDFAKNELANSSPSGDRGYHYNGLVTNIIMNYMVFKSGDKFDELMNQVFRDKVGIANDVYFFKNRVYREGVYWYMFYASRYDYLRIARSILNDWHSENCVGNYLREIYSKRELKSNISNPNVKNKNESARSYGGQFHMDYISMENRRIFGMDGYGGQAILIDFDNSRIVVVNTIHTNYDWYELVHQVIKNGYIRD